MKLFKILEIKTNEATDGQLLMEEGDIKNFLTERYETCRNMQYKLCGL